MSNIGCRILKEFKRVDPESISKFKDLPVSNIGDTTNRLYALDSSIKPYNNTKMCGSALTVKVAEGDNLMFHKAMDLAKPGDVIVIDAGGYTNRAILGELMTKYCHIKGIAGLVVDGSIRDSDALKQLNIPVYAKGVSPNGPFKNGPGEINYPVTVGGQIIRAGDLIVGDADGVISIPSYSTSEVLDNSLKIFQTESIIDKKIEEKGLYERPWVDEKLKEIGCDIN